MIWISRRSISIVDYGPIWNPTTNPNRQSQFQSNFDKKIDLFGYKIYLFRYKIDLFWYKIDLFRLKDQKRPSKCRLINRKWQIILITTINIKNDVQNDHFWSNSTNFRCKSNYLRYKWNYFRYKWSGVESSWWFWLISSTISDCKSWLEDNLNPISNKIWLKVD